MAVMKAVVLHEHGGRERLTLENIPDPEPGPGQVRVRVRAVALNHLDIWVREGLPHLRLAYPHILGSDVAGEVDLAGPGVEDLERGRRVLLQPAVSCGHCEQCLSGGDNLCHDYAILGENTRGGYAEYIVVPRESILPHPEGMEPEQAACIPLTFQTAWQMAVRRAGVCAGQTVVVHGAGSGVTVAAVQICKVLGARVIATSTAGWKLERIRELGADDTILSTEQDVGRRVRELTDGRGADVVLEHVGTPMWKHDLRAVRWGGTIAVCGATGGHGVELDLRQVFFKQIALVGSTMGSRADLWQVLRLVERGRLRPVVDRVLPLEDAARAHEHLEGSGQFGKVVLRVD